jgi:hypothetical protein
MKLLLAMVLFANMGFLYPTYTLFLLSRDLNLTEILTLESVMALGIMLWEVPSSVLADRWGRKKLIVLARLLELVSMVPMFWVRGFLPFAVLYAVSWPLFRSRAQWKLICMKSSRPFNHGAACICGEEFAGVDRVVGGHDRGGYPLNGYSSASAWQSLYHFCPGSRRLPRYPKPASSGRAWGASL